MKTKRWLNAIQKTHRKSDWLNAILSDDRRVLLILDTMLALALSGY